MIGVGDVLAEFEARFGHFLHGSVPYLEYQPSAAAARRNFIGAWNFP
jgi:hypothetical protein